MFSAIIACAISYILGSIPNGLILGKMIWNTDLRQHGSGNIGATNAWRTIGKPAGILIFLLDFLKGAIAALMPALITFIGLNAPEEYIYVLVVLCGIAALVGHSCSIFLGFKGGKSVATGLGVLSMMMPQVTVMVFLIWFLVFLSFLGPHLQHMEIPGYVSLGSIIAAGLVPILAWLIGYHPAYQVFGLFAAVFVIYRHKSNIERLRNGTESKIKPPSRHR